MAIKAPDSNEIIKFLIVGMVFLFLITSFINFSAIGSDDPDAKIFKSDFDYEATASGFFTLLIVGAAVWLTWNFTLGFTGRLDKKRLVTMVIMGIALYFIYNKILVPSGFLNLEPLEFAAYQLQAVIMP